MPKAVWKGAVIAEADADRCEIVDGNTYFPHETVKRDHVRPCDHTSHCPWKGDAKYYDVVVSDQVNSAAAWYYPDAKEKAKHFENYVAFWNGVSVEA